MIKKRAGKPTDYQNALQALIKFLTSIFGKFVILITTLSTLIGSVALFRSNLETLSLMIILSLSLGAWLCCFFVQFEPGIKDGPKFPLWAHRLAYIGTVLIPVFTVAALFETRHRSEIVYTLDFEDHAVTFDYLKQRDWIVLQYDSSTFNIDRRFGYLSIRTQRGDFWRKKNQGEFMPPRNIVARKCTSADLTTTCVIDDFAPYHNWQQAGIVLMRDTIGFDDWVRFTVGYSDYNLPNGVLHLQYACSRNGDVEVSEHETLRLINSEPEKKIWLQIKKQGDRYTFRYRLGEGFWEMRTWRSIEYSLSQTYVGFAAFQGITERQSDGTDMALDQDPVVAWVDAFTIDETQ